MWPNQVQRPQIVNVVGDADSDLELYREVLTQFMLEGQNKTRVDWTLERFAAAKPTPIAQPADDTFCAASIRAHVHRRRQLLLEFGNLRLEQDALTEALAQVVGQLTEIESTLDAEPIDTRVVDEELTKAETVLDEALVIVIPDAEIVAINAEVAEQLKPYRAQLEATAYAATFHRAVLKRLHEHFALPRLGLFTL